MRFAFSACKFEGLLLRHQFFYDLMSLLEAISLNVRGEEERKFARKIMKAFTLEYLEKPYEMLPQQMVALILSRGPHTNLLWISN